MLVLKRREYGFTLIELLITVIIIAISISLVTPFGQIAERFRLDYFNQRVYSSAILVKSEAIKRSQLVSACQSNSGTSCDGDANWAGGWVIFENPNNDDLIDPTEEVIRVYNAIDSNIEISWGGGTRLSFTSAGVPVASGEFSMCPSTSRAIEERVVNVTSTGLISKQVRGACP